VTGFAEEWPAMTGTTPCFLFGATSVAGTRRTSRNFRYLSAYEAEADVSVISADFRS
jgi:hypothetical protein